MLQIRNEEEPDYKAVEKLRALKLGTPTATAIWMQRLEDYSAFYKKLRAQLASSAAIL